MVDCAIDTLRRGAAQLRGPTGAHPVSPATSTPRVVSGQREAVAPASCAPSTPLGSLLPAQRGIWPHWRGHASWWGTAWLGRIGPAPVGESTRGVEGAGRLREISAGLPKERRRKFTVAAQSPRPRKFLILTLTLPTDVNLGGQSWGVTQEGRPLAGPAFLEWVFRRCPTLPRGLPRSTIGAEGLNFRVRDGTGCFPLAMAAATLLKYQPSVSRPYSGNRTVNASAKVWLAVKPSAC
jgi:hypothetical protein